MHLFSSRLSDSKPTLITHKSQLLNVSAQIWPTNKFAYQTVCLIYTMLHMYLVLRSTAGTFSVYRFFSCAESLLHCSTIDVPLNSPFRPWDTRTRSAQRNGCRAEKIGKVVKNGVRQQTSTWAKPRLPFLGSQYSGIDDLRTGAEAVMRVGCRRIVIVRKLQSPKQSATFSFQQQRLE